MALYNIFLAVVVCFSATVFADLQEEIEEAIKCGERHRISVDDMSKAVIECYKNKLLNNPDFISNRDNVEFIIKAVCSFEDPTSCLMENTRFFRQTCLSAELTERFEKTMDQLGSTYKIACKDHGSRILAFINKGGVQCIQNLIGVSDSKVLHCLEENFNASRDDLIKNADNEKKTHELECRLSYQMKGCLIGGMTSCADARKLLEDVADELFREIECSAFAPDSSTAIQASSLLTFILSFVLTSYFRVMA